MYYPLDIHQVFLVPEDTVHYGIAGSNADIEWESIIPPGRGFVRLGRERRWFGIALYHQVHCLDLIRRAIGNQNYTKHVHHCFNYLREAVLCEADTTIEGQVLSLGSGVGSTTAEKMCNDWTQVYMAAKGAYDAESKA